MSDINAIIPAEALKGIDDVNEKLNTTHERLIQIAKDVTQLNFGGSNFKQFSDNSDKLGEGKRKLADADRVLADLAAKYNLQLGEQGQIIAQLRVKKAELEKQNRELAKANLAEEGSITQLRAKLALMIADYNKLSAAERETGAAGKKLAADISAATNQLDSMQKTTVAATNAIRGYSPVGAQFNQLLRELPNLAQSPQIFIQSLTNNISYFFESVKAELQTGKTLKDVLTTVTGSVVGLVGIVNIATLAFAYFSKNMGKSSEAVELAAKANKKYAESLKDIEENAMKSAYEETARLRLLEQVATDETATREKRNRAIKEMRKMGADYLKLFDDEAIKAGKAKTAIDELTKAILQNAVAEAASKKYAAAYLKERELAQSEEKAVNTLVEAKQKLKDFEKRAAQEREGLFGQREENATLRQATERARFQADVDAAQEEYDNIYNLRTNAIKDYQQYQNLAADAMKKIPNLLGGETKTGTGSKFDSTNTEINAAQRKAKAIAEMNKAELQNEMIKQKEIADNTELYYRTRLEANSRYLNAALQLNDMNAAEETQGIQIKLDKIEKIEAKAADKRTNAERVLLLEKDALQAEKAALTYKYSTEETKIIAAAGKEQLGIIRENSKAETQYRIDAINNLIENNSNLQAQEEQTLIDQLKKRLITYEEYEKKRLEIKRKYEAKALTDTIDYLEDLLNNDALSGDERRQLQEKLDAARVALAKNTNAQIEASGKKLSEDEKLRQQALKQLYQLAYDSIIQFSRNATDQRIKDIDAKSEREQRDFQNEIDRLQYSTLTQEEKYNKMADLQAAADAKQQDAENKKRVEQQKQVEFERQIALAMVAFELVKGLAKEVGSKGVAGLATGAAISAYVTALSGALAAVASPKYYAEGTGAGGHGGGSAVVGEGVKFGGFVPEYVQEPNKAGYWVTSPTFYPNLAQGTIVTPLDKMAANLASNGVSANYSAGKQAAAAGVNIAGVVNAMAAGVTSAISKQPKHITNVTGKGIEHIYVNGNYKTNIINNTGF